MPYQVNGFGTWYWGRERVHRHLATCEFCGSYSRLTSYDTRLYVTALGIPLVPLGRKRVLDECPACTKHRSMPLRQWRQLKEASIEEAVAGYLKSPHDINKTIEVIGTAVFFEDEDTFLGLTEQIETNHADDAEVLAALGGAYAFFSHPDAAVEAFEESLRLKEDPRVRQMLSLLLLHLNRPADAEHHLRHALKEKPEEKSGLIELTVRGYQSRGMHREALNLIDHSRTTVPSLQDERVFDRLRATSERHEATGKPIGKPFLPDIDTPAGGDRKWTGRLAAAIGPLLLLTVLAVYFGAALYQGQTRSVHVVNGLDRGYTVRIGGQEVRLPGHGRRLIELAEGDIEVVVLGDDPAIPPQRCRIKTPLLTRPFNDSTFVINPDRVAVLEREEVHYSLAPDDDAIYPYEVRAGELLYRFDGIDYLFQPAPDEIRIAGEDAVAVRERIGLVQAPSSADVAGLLAESEGMEACTAYLRRRVEYDPSRIDDLTILGAMMDGGEFLALLRDRLDDRPVRVDWHRTYQEVLPRLDPDHDLTGEYRASLEEDPANPSLVYLLGRATEDSAAAEALFRRAAEGEPPSAYALNAIAYHRLVRGRYEEALEWVDRAIALDPDNQTFQTAHSETRYALGRFDELLEQVRAQKSDNPLDPTLAPREVYLLAMQGKPDEAAAVIRGYGKQLDRMGAPIDQIRHVTALLQSMVAYAMGDVAGFLQHAEAVPDLFGLEASLLRGDLEEAARRIEEFYLPRTHDRLLLYALATRADRHELAARQLATAVEEMKAAGPDQRRAAEWLEGDRPPEEREARALPLLPDTKRIILTALTARFPNHGDRYRPLAERLNYNRHHPYLVIQRLLAQP